jgi:hypothetical protein
MTPNKTYLDHPIDVNPTSGSQRWRCRVCSLRPPRSTS